MTYTEKAATAPENVLRVYILYMRGCGERTIAERLGVSERTVRRILDAASPPIRKEKERERQ